MSPHQSAAAAAGAAGVASVASLLFALGAACVAAQGLDTSDGATQGARSSYLELQQPAMLSITP